MKRKAQRETRDVSMQIFPGRSDGDFPLYLRPTVARPYFVTGAGDDVWTAVNACLHQMRLLGFAPPAIRGKLAVQVHQAVAGAGNIIRVVMFFAAKQRQDKPTNAGCRYGSDALANMVHHWQTPTYYIGGYDIHDFGVLQRIDYVKAFRAIFSSAEQKNPWPYVAVGCGESLAEAVQYALAFCSLGRFAVLDMRRRITLDYGEHIWRAGVSVPKVADYEEPRIHVVSLRWDEWPLTLGNETAGQGADQ